MQYFCNQGINPFYGFCLAIVVGFLAGLSTVFFRKSIYWIRALFYGSKAPLLFQLGFSLSWWWVCVVLTVGGIILSLIIRYLTDDKRTQSIAHVMVSYHKEEYISFRSGFFGALTNSCAVAFGASVGREGPALHFAAAVTSWFARFFSIKGTYFRVILATAIASSISASFDTPITGFVFALEIVLLPISVFSFIPILTGSIIGALLTRQLEGLFPAFTIPEYTLFLPSYSMGFIYEIPFFAILGVICGVIAYLFMEIICFLKVSTAPSNSPIPFWLWAGLAGLLTAVIGLFYPEIFGTSYYTINLSLTIPFSIGTLLALFCVKLIATSACLGFGFGGGIFTPSLFLGGILGSLLGQILQILFPHLVLDYRPYAFAGMAAFTGTLFGTPIALTLIIFELTKDYYLAMNVFVTVVSAHFVRKKLIKESYFEWMRMQMTTTYHQ